MKKQFTIKTVVFIAGAFLTCVAHAATKVTSSDTLIKNLGTTGTYKNVKEIELGQDITLGADITVKKTCTIRSVAGKKYKLTIPKARKITVNSGYTLTLQNITLDGANNERDSVDFMTLNGTVILGDGATIQNVKSVPEITTETTGTWLNRKTVTVTNDCKVALIVVNNTGKIQMLDGSAILNCSNACETKSGTIYNNGGDVIIDGGTIAGCSTKGSGGAIYTISTRTDQQLDLANASMGDIYLNGGVLTNNSCGVGVTAKDTMHYGGAIYLGSQNAMLHVKGPAIVSDNFCRVGGQKIADDVSTFKLLEEHTKNLKLWTIEDEDALAKAYIGVRYPNRATLAEAADAQDKWFASVWKGQTANEASVAMFHWNGDATVGFKGQLLDNTKLTWNGIKEYKLPADAKRLADEVKSADWKEGEKVKIALTNNATVDTTVAFPKVSGLTIELDLNGYELIANFDLDAGAQMHIIDSSTQRTGRLSGSLTSRAAKGSDDYNKAYVIDSGSFSQMPARAWIANNEKSTILENYTKNYPFTITRWAWDATNTAYVADATTVQLKDSDTEIRVVGYRDDGSYDIDKITFSTGDWIDLAHTNENFHVDVFAAPAAKMDGKLYEVGERLLLYSSDPAMKARVTTSYGREDDFNWEGVENSYGLIKLIHITKNVKGESATTNQTEYAYFQLPDPEFRVTQRADLPENSSVRPRAGSSIGMTKGMSASAATAKPRHLQPIRVNELLLRALGYNRAVGFAQSSVNVDLDQMQANGLRVWENLVTGTESDHLLVCATETQDGGRLLRLSLAEDSKVHRTETGYQVFYDLRRSTTNGWVRVSEVKERPIFTVPLLDEKGNSLDATGYYRVTTLIIPDANHSVTNEINSTNIVGVLEVESTMTNTLATVPWKAMRPVNVELPNNEDVKVADYLKESYLATNDCLLAINDAISFSKDQGLTFHQWTRSEDNEWRGATTVKKSGVIAAQDPNTFGLNRGNAVWIMRSVEPTKRPIFLIGQYSDERLEITIKAGTTERNGDVCTHVSNPSLEPVEINSYMWGEMPLSTDLISIPNGNNSRLLLRWKMNKKTGVGAWGSYVYDEKTFKSVWTTNFKIPAGMGFWYHRTGEEFKIPLPHTAPAKDLEDILDEPVVIEK